MALMSTRVFVKLVILMSTCICTLITILTKYLDIISCQKGLSHDRIFHRQCTELAAPKYGTHLVEL